MYIWECNCSVFMCSEDCNINQSDLLLWKSQGLQFRHEMFADSYQRRCYFLTIYLFCLRDTFLITYKIMKNMSANLLIKFCFSSKIYRKVRLKGINSYIKNCTSEGKIPRHQISCIQMTCMSVFLSSTCPFSLPTCLWKVNWFFSLVLFLLYFICATGQLYLVLRIIARFVRQLSLDNERII